MTGGLFLLSCTSYDGPDSAGLRYQNLSNDTVEIKIEEDTSLDDETVHTTENIGFLAIEGTGTLTGETYIGFAEKVSPKFMPLLTKNFLTNQ